MSSWSTYFTGDEASIIAANDRIDSNCGFPNGCTERWSIPQKAYEQDFWFILMPPPEGYMTPCGQWTQAQMIEGVSNVNIEESQSNWWPPYPPRKG